MSPNCWASITDALRGQSPCRYLEWGSGNSTLAALNLALQQRESARFELTSIESDPAFFQAMLGAVARVLAACANPDTHVRLEPLTAQKLTLVVALRSDPLIERYEAHLLKVLWLTRNDRFWIPSAQPDTSHLGITGLLRRILITLRCSAGYRWERLRRALAAQAEPRSLRLTIDQLSEVEALQGPHRLVVDVGPVHLDYLLIPPLRNWIWDRHRILDGLYQEFSDYVCAPVEGPFDVILVDGRARTSCLKRVRSEDLLAAGGTLFVHDAHRPSQSEALHLFDVWSYVQGIVQGPADAKPQAPLIFSGTSTREAKVVNDHELFFYQRPKTASPESPL